MLTIQGGQWRGRKLKALDREGLRPSSARVKASIFSILESLVWKRRGSPGFEGWRCLDLFAGVGGLGLEMLSRGAARCVFVEKDRVSARTLQQNVDALGCGTQVTLLVGDVFEHAWESNGPFDLILLDPPYRDSHLPELLERLSTGPVLVDGGLVLFEHDPGIRATETAGLRIESSRVLGPAGITVFSRNA